MLSRMKNRKGFTLIELMVVVAIIGILAAIAIPMFRTLQVKAKLTEGTRAVSTVASALGDYFQDEEMWPAACGTVAAINNTLGVGISTSHYVAAMTTDNSGLITVTYVATGLGDANGHDLTLTATVDAATGAIRWDWGTNGGMPAKFIPKE